MSSRRFFLFAALMSISASKRRLVSSLATWSSIVPICRPTWLPSMTTIDWGSPSDDRIHGYLRFDRVDQHEGRCAPSCEVVPDAYSGSIVTTEWVLLEFADAFSLSSAKPLAIEAIKRIHRLPMFVVMSSALARLFTGLDSTFT